jgi:hypothetical protein
MPGGTFIPIRLEDLVGDVLIATPGNGQVLTYSSGTWVNGTPSSGGSPGGGSGQVQVNDGAGGFAGAVGAFIDSTGRLGLGTASPSYDIDTRHTGTYPANVVRFQGPSDLDALSVRIVSGTGVIWEANAGYGTLHIRSNTIALEANDGSNTISFIDSSAWSDHATANFIVRGVAGNLGGLILGPQGGPYERVQITTKGLVIASTPSQFVTTPPTGMLDVRSDSPSKPVLVVQGAPLQYGNLQEWYPTPSSNQPVAILSGNYTTGPILFLSGNTAPEFGANAINGLEVRGSICTVGGFATKTGGGYLVTASCVGDVFRFRENNITGNVPLAMDMIANAIGFYSVTPVARQLLATGAGHTVDDVITALQNLGLLRQS